jgi:integrase
MRPRWKGFQSPLADGIERFLKHKRAIGRKYRGEEQSLRLFDQFLVQRGVECLEEITPEIVDEILISRPSSQVRSYNVLVGVLRLLFDWLVVRGDIPQSPLRAKPRRHVKRRTPFLLSSTEARRLLDLAGSLAENDYATPLRGPVYRTIFALLYGLGLRVGEVSRLCCEDLDFDRDLLVIRRTKFAKSRLVPFGPKMASLLREYFQLRAARCGTLSEQAPLFSFRRGRPVAPGTISKTFHDLVPQLGLTVPPGMSPPRAHDLRHAFAVGTLLRWYRAGIEPSTRLLHLSTFLGHVDPGSTAVYLTITSELLNEASQRFESFARSFLWEVPS